MRGGEGVLVRFLGGASSSHLLASIRYIALAEVGRTIGSNGVAPLSACWYFSLSISRRQAGKEWDPGHDVSVFDGVVPLFPLDLYALEFFSMMFQVVHPHLGKVAVYVRAPSAMSRSLVAQTPPRVYTPSIVLV